MPCNNSSDSTLKTRPLVQNFKWWSLSIDAGGRTSAAGCNYPCPDSVIYDHGHVHRYHILIIITQKKDFFNRTNATAGSVCGKVWRCAKWQVRVLNCINPCVLWKCSTTMIISKINGLWTIIKADCWDFVETLRGWRLIAWEWESCPAQAAG